MGYQNILPSGAYFGARVLKHFAPDVLKHFKPDSVLYQVCMHNLKVLSRKIRQFLSKNISVRSDQNMSQEQNMFPGSKIF